MCVCVCVPSTLVRLHISARHSNDISHTIPMQMYVSCKYNKFILKYASRLFNTFIYFSDTKEDEKFRICKLHFSLSISLSLSLSLPLLLSSCSASFSSFQSLSLVWLFFFLSSVHFKTIVGTYLLLCRNRLFTYMNDTHTRSASCEK